MSVEKFQRDISNLFNFPTDQNPTTQEDYVAAVKNWVETIKNLVDCNLWQPTTDYAVGNILRTPSLPPQNILLCTQAGTSGSEEPDYSDAEVGDIITDGTVVYTLQTMVSLGEIEAYFTEIIERLENGEGVIDNLWEVDLENDLQPKNDENVVPKTNGGGTLGTSAKKWDNVYTNGLTVSGTATATTPTAGDNSTKIATTEFVTTKAGNYLPLAGGAMTGAIHSNGVVIKCTADNNLVQIDGGTEQVKGASLYLFGKDMPTYGGEFTLRASNGTLTKDLTGQPGGMLRWAGQALATQVYADAAITTAAYSCTGSISAGTWGDLVGAISYPTGYTRFLGVVSLNVASPGNMTPLSWWTSSNGNLVIRTRSIGALSSASITGYALVGR